jgi:murein DD-endopeptidase MepM/ murein hydrolase activator NlpD
VRATRIQPLISITALALLSASPAAAQTTAEESRSTIEELRAIESRIRTLLAEQVDRSARRTEGSSALGDVNDSVEREWARIDREERESRERLERAREQLHATGPLLLHAATRRRPVARENVALTIAHGLRREIAGDAIARLLHLAELRDRRRADRDRFGGSLAADEAFSEMGLDELRRRHRALTDRLDRLHVEAAANGDALTKWIAGLARPSERTGAAEPAARPAVALPEFANEPPPKSTPNGLRPSLETALPSTAGAAGEPSGPRRQFWRGSPTSVAALAPGRVAFAGPFAGYSHLLVIDHGAGWTSLYGNLSECALRKGEAVVAGQRVGRHATAPNTRPEPFWIEVRSNAEPVEIERLPGVGGDWETRLFTEGPRRAPDDGSSIRSRH